MGELLFARGKVFAAHQELTLALKLAVAGSATQVRLQQQAAKLETLISSGQAVDIEKAAEEAAAQALKAAEAAKLAQAEVKMTSDRGNTVVRRKGEGAQAPAQGQAAQALPHLGEPAKAPQAAVTAPAPAQAAPAAPVVTEAVPAAPAPAAAAPAATEPAPAVTEPAGEVSQEAKSEGPSAE